MMEPTDDSSPILLAQKITLSQHICAEFSSPQSVPGPLLQEVQQRQTGDQEGSLVGG